MTNNICLFFSKFNKSGKSIMQFVRIVAVILILLLAGLFFFCFSNAGLGIIAMATNSSRGDPSIPARNEIVMPPNATITATTDTGTIVIKSGAGLKRYYTWDGATRSVAMWPRSERWYGSLGIYYPGPGSHWVPNNGITRGVLEEGQQHFDTREEAIEWLRRRKQGSRSMVYRDDGLVVFFAKRLKREQLNVDVWQIYIGGKEVSEYQETAFSQESVKIWNKSKKEIEEELDSIYDGRKSRIYRKGGEKPTKLEGSNNSAITTSWDKN